MIVIGVGKGKVARRNESVCERQWDEVWCEWCYWCMKDPVQCPPSVLVGRCSGLTMEGIFEVEGEEVGLGIWWKRRLKLKSPQ